MEKNGGCLQTCKEEYIKNSKNDRWDGGWGSLLKLTAEPTYKDNF